MVERYGRGKADFVHQSPLEILPTQSFSSKADVANEMSFALRSICIILRRVLLHAIKSHGMGPTALLPLRRKACYEFLAFFQKMKLGLSNHQPVCVCVCVCVCLSVCPPLITFEPIGGCSWNLVGRCCHSRWPRRHVFFNLVASAIPKWLTFKLLRWM
jgi:hypothetical protein